MKLAATAWLASALYLSSLLACDGSTPGTVASATSGTLAGGGPTGTSTTAAGLGGTANGGAGGSTTTTGGGGQGAGGAPPGGFTLTFQVDVGSNYTGAVSVGNSVDGWDMAGKVQLSDADKDGVYVGSMQLPAGTFMEYKFIHGSSGSGSWENVPLGCGLKTGDYTNRTVVMPARDLTLALTAFSACPAVVNTSDCKAAPGRDVAVTIEGAMLRIGKQAIHMKGVSWSPTAIGKGPGSGAGDFDNYAAIDVPLLAQAGINVVRTYGPIMNRSVLDKLYSEGIYVLNTVFYGYQESATTARNKVCALKDHPAILAWVVGNEWNYNNLGRNISLTQAAANVAAVVQAIKEQDSTRPVSTVYGELPSAAIYNTLKDVDLWGINAYRGGSFGNLFKSWNMLSPKPMYLGEYGSDAYNGLTNAPDETMQANIVQSLTQEIFDNSSAVGLGRCAGGMVFSFADEWWKSSAGGWGEHDTQSSWQNGAYPDPFIHEEWWGLVDVYRKPRKAYDTYAQLKPPAP